MSLRERLLGRNKEAEKSSAIASDAPMVEESRHSDPAYQELKLSIHSKLLEKANLTLMETMPENELRAELAKLIGFLVDDEKVILNSSEREQLIIDIQDEVLGLGPLEPLLSDPTISDILVNSYRQVFIERKGVLEKTHVCFANEAHLLKIIDKIVSRIGRRIDESSPMVDARLEDGSRVNAVIKPLSIDGACLSIRKFSVDPLKMEDLLTYGSLTEEIAVVLKSLVKAKVNLIISGGTGSGKTTLLNIMSAAIPENERILTIEDAAELQLQQPHVVRLESRPANLEGRGEVTQRALVKNSLRMRPDRIIVGEVRGSEALDMLQAMNTGHEGSITTIHANSPRDALTRLEHMVSMAGLNIPPRAMRQQISSALSVIVQISRLSDGKRKLVSLQEITGCEGDVISMQEIFGFNQTGISSNGVVEGYFYTTGVAPHFIERLHRYGISLPENMFNPRHLS